MKKTLLFVILALSINAYAQNKRPTSNKQHQTSNSMENVQGKMEVGGWKTSGIYSEKNAGQAIKHQTPKQLIQLYDSIYQWQWDTLSIGWAINPYYKYINIVYDANNNQTSELGQSWNGSAWVNDYQCTFTYDANNNMTSGLRQSWNGSAWENYEQYIFTYDANNNMTSRLNQSWNGSAWENYEQYIITYDANNNMTSRLNQSWNGSAWVNNWQHTYTYDANNNLTSELFQSWNGSAWENSCQYTYTYDANNNRTSRLRQNWNGSAWVNNWQNTYTYDANNNMTSEFDQYWNGSTWEDSSQDTYTYDASNNLTSEFDQYWNGSAWVNSLQCTYTYDVNNFLESESYKFWNGAGTEVTDGDSTYYYFHTVVVGINDLIVREGSITVYPNPSADGKFTISSNSTISSIEIYNVLGEKIYSKQINSEKADIDLSKQANGIYFYQIKNEKKILKTGKIIIE
ncbi:MAG: T9SS type A sorting domain-containing protein [Bacteroidales bacterium]